VVSSIVPLEVTIKASVQNIYKHDNQMVLQRCSGHNSSELVAPTQPERIVANSFMEAQLESVAKFGVKQNNAAWFNNFLK